MKAVVVEKLKYLCHACAKVEVVYLRSIGVWACGWCGRYSQEPPDGAQG